MNLIEFYSRDLGSRH